MDRYRKEVLLVSTRKHDIKGSVSLRYKFHFLKKVKRKFNQEREQNDKTIFFETDVNRVADSSQSLGRSHSIS